MITIIVAPSAGVGVHGIVFPCMISSNYVKNIKEQILLLVLYRSEIIQY